jgi:hypothetical protein
MVGSGPPGRDNIRPLAQAGLRVGGTRDSPVPPGGSPGGRERTLGKTVASAILQRVVFRRAGRPTAQASGLFCPATEQIRLAVLCEPSFSWTWVSYRCEPEKKEETKQDQHRPLPGALASAVGSEQACHASSSECPRRVKKPRASMGKLPKKLRVATVPSPKSLVKLTPSSEHHEQGPDHENQGQKEH